MHISVNMLNSTKHMTQAPSYVINVWLLFACLLRMLSVFLVGESSFSAAV